MRRSTALSAAAGFALGTAMLAIWAWRPERDAEPFHNGGSVVVRTSHEAVLYRTAALLRGEVRPYFRIRIDGLRESQGEGIAIDGTMLYLSSEGRGWNRGGWFVSLRCRLPE